MEMKRNCSVGCIGFICCMNLSVRTLIRVIQMLEADLHQGKIAFCSRILSSFQKRVNYAHYFVNIDQTPVFMNFAPHHTVRRKGKKYCVHTSRGVNLQRFSLAVAVAMDGTELFLFVVFKVIPGGVIDRSLLEITPNGIVCAVQDKK